MLRIARFIVLAVLSLGFAIASFPSAHARTMTVAQDYDPSDLFGTLSTNNPMLAILESLYMDNPLTHRIEPHLAVGYEKINDKEILIKLREGVRFSNGEPMNAAAVAHSIRLFADPKLVPAYGVYAPMIDHAEAVDERVVRLFLSRPSPLLDLLLAQILVVPPGYWEKVGAKGFGQHPIGTGPFKLTKWSKDDRIVMDRNPVYWGTPPQGIDQIIWRTVPDATARAAGLKTGEFDLAANLPAIEANDIETVDGLKIYAGDVARVFQLILSSLPQHPGPIQDKRVRQAINYAIDKKGIIDALYYGKARPLNGQVILPGQPGYDPELRDYPFDPAKAKALLAEAGYPNGFTTELRCPANRYPQGRETCEAILEMLGKVGIRAKLTLLESGEFIRQLVSRELAPIGILGIGVPDDPSYGLALFRSNWRYSYYQNPALDQAIDASSTEMDPEKRAAFIRQAGRILYDDAAIAFLFGAREFYGHTARLENFATNTAQRYFFHFMKLN